MAAILLIEDDRTFARIIEGFLLKRGYSVKVVHTGKEGMEIFQQQPANLVLLDYRLPDSTGLEILKKMKNTRPEIPVILMTSFMDIRTAVKAIKAGAFEYVTKPVNPDELVLVLEQALNNTKQREHSGRSEVLTYIEGSSEESQKLQDFIRLVAATDMTVILEGESGTGKEYAANAIHKRSKRADAPFVAVDCGALPKDLASSILFGHVKGAFTGAVSSKSGQFEVANGGTLFLDEVGNLSYEVQVKLLRAIQERVVNPLGSNKEIKTDVRIITATNENLQESVKRGEFREDLYHRLNEFKIQVPSLRDRADDLFEFSNFFREEANHELNRVTEGFDEQVVSLFNAYDWPGNLRELKNTIRRAVLLTPGKYIGIQALPSEMIDAIRNPQLKQIETESVNLRYDLKAMQEKQERELIIKTLKDVRHNKSKAARLLNIDRKTLYLKMEKYNIQ
jgi:two-component system, NtrC family, response regulator HydG